MVEWRNIPVANFEHYEVSNDGRIRRNGRELKGSVFLGYRKIVLSDAAGIEKNFRINRLVCEAFHGPAPLGFHAAHLDGDRSNDKAANLAWKSAKENNADKAVHGTNQIGERHPRAKLTYAQVLAIKGSAEPVPSLVARYSLDRSQIYRIRAGTTWTEYDATKDKPDAD